MAVSPAATRASEQVDELYRAHGPAIYRYALAMLDNPSDAEDVTQTTFMNALRALERGEQPRNAESWLVAIAHNLVRERYRRARTRPLEVALEPEAVGAPQDEDQTNPSVDDILRAMAGIPESQRSALVLREFEGRPYAEIAQTLRMTTSALETLLFRARRSLAEELENLMTCARAEADLARLRGEGLSRKERRRLEEHLKECPACTRLSATRPRRLRALQRGLLLLPFPIRLFGGGHGAASAGSAATLSGAAAGSGGAATTGGGVVLGGLAAKVAVVVATTAVASGVGYEGVSHLTKQATPTPASSHRAPQAAGRGRAGSARERTPAPPALIRSTISSRLKKVAGSANGATTRSRAGGSGAAMSANRGATAGRGNGALGHTGASSADKSGAKGETGGKSAAAGSNSGKAKANGQMNETVHPDVTTKPSTQPFEDTSGSTGATATPTASDQPGSNGSGSANGQGKSAESGKS